MADALLCTQPKHFGIHVKAADYRRFTLLLDTLSRTYKQKILKKSCQTTAAEFLQLLNYESDFKCQET